MNVTPKCSRWQRTGENRTEINELQVKCGKLPLMQKKNEYGWGCIRDMKVAMNNPVLSYGGSQCIGNIERVLCARTQDRKLLDCQLK